MEGFLVTASYWKALSKKMIFIKTGNLGPEVYKLGQFGFG